MIVSAVNVVLSIFLMIGLGMLLVHLGWLKDEHTKVISRLVVSVSLPAMIIHNIFTQFTRDELLSSASGILISFLSVFLTALFALAAARVFRIPRARRGAFFCMMTFSNSVFIGVPVSLALFGEQAMPFALLYYIANTSVFWSWGYAMLRADSGRKSALDLKKILPLPLGVFVGCIALLLMGVRMPTFILSAAQYMGNLVTPLSMLFTGMIIMRMLKARRVRWHKGYGAIVLCRFIISPATVILLSRFFPDASPLMRNVLIVQAAMPVMSQTPIVAGSCGSDEEYAAGGVMLTALLSLIFIPGYMAVIPLL